MNEKKYRTFARQFYLEEAGLPERLGRDLRLLKWMLQNILIWCRARKVRAEFRQCRERGEPFYVDRFAGPPSEK